MQWGSLRRGGTSCSESQAFAKDCWKGATQRGPLTETALCSCLSPSLGQLQLGAVGNAQYTRMGYRRAQTARTVLSDVLMTLAAQPVHSLQLGRGMGSDRIKVQIS